MKLHTLPSTFSLIIIISTILNKVSTILTVSQNIALGIQQAQQYAQEMQWDPISPFAIKIIYAIPEANPNTPKTEPHIIMRLGTTPSQPGHRRWAFATQTLSSHWGEWSRIVSFGGQSDHPADEPSFEWNPASLEAANALAKGVEGYGEKHEWISIALHEDIDWTMGEGNMWVFKSEGKDTVVVSGQRAARRNYDDFDPPGGTILGSTFL